MRSISEESRAGYRAFDEQIQKAAYVRTFLRLPGALFLPEPSGFRGLNVAGVLVRATGEWAPENGCSGRASEPGLEDEAGLRGPCQIRLP